MRAIQNHTGFTVWHARVLAGMLLCIAAGQAAWGQCEPEWTRRVDVPEHRRDAAMVFDSWRGVALMIGGWIGPNDPGVQYLWEWQGTKWTRRDVIGPTERLDLAELAFDSDRGVTVLHTQLRNRPSQTWEFDGDSWALVGGGPPAGGDRTMTYDAARGVTLLWGERGIGTWSWDGTAWTFLEPGPQPADASLKMAYDSVREVVVMFGWADVVAETWEWAGQGWTRVAVGGPPLRFGHAMAFDSGRGVTVLFGGATGGSTLDDTWTWDGVSWTQVAAGEPSARLDHAMAYDSVRGEMLVFGGQGDVRELLNETWGWDGQTWRLRDEGEPLARSGHNMVFDSDRDVAVMFGSAAGVAETWEHNGMRWRPITTVGPSARRHFGFTYDEQRQLSVLFAGSANGNNPIDGDTWTWDGNTWMLASVLGPDPRFEVGMTFDSVRNVTVLFGGTDDLFGYFGDTWLWDGSQWFLDSETGPPPRSRPAMTYNSERGVVVLFGGFFKPLEGENVIYGDTWEWNGAWTIRADTGPAPRFGASMAFDPITGRTVLFGGGDSANHNFDDLWEWDGSGWNTILIEGPTARRNAPMVWASDRRALFLHGGGRTGGSLADTWTLTSQRPGTGDLNCDCTLNAFDIEPFIVALFQPEDYPVIYPNCDIMLADINSDGSVNAFDIEPFIELLFDP